MTVELFLKGGCLTEIHSLYSHFETQIGIQEEKE